MTTSLKTIDSFFVLVKTKNTKLANTFFVHSDIRCGKRIAIAEQYKDSTGINLLTDYMTYSNMYTFLQGIMFKYNQI
jgi:hypothetical protein